MSNREDRGSLEGADRRETEPAPISYQSAQSQRPGNESEQKGEASDSIKPVQEGWNPEEREHHRKERVYWRLSAFLTFIAVLGAVATVILSQLSLTEARRATVEATRQANEAKRQADLAQEQNRPFVGVPKIQVLRSGLGFVFINHGREPTIGFNVEAIEKAQDVDRVPIVTELCKRSNKFTEEAMTYTVIPDTNWITAFDFIHLSIKPTDTGRHIIYGCLAYRTPNDNRIRHTGFFGDFTISAIDIAEQNFFAVNAD